MHFGERGRRDRFFDRHFRRRWFYGEDEFGFFGYPFYGYGVGLFADCPDWLVPDWESQENYGGECNTSTGIEPQNTMIAAYGADQTYSPDQGYGAAQADTLQIYGAYAQRALAGAAAKQGEAEQGSGSAAFDTVAGPRQPDTLVYLADGTNYAVTNYWLAGGDLHYVTSYGAEDSVPIGQIDLQRTVDANAAVGVQFTLRPAATADDARGER